jgi:hypothetical protein
MTPNRYLGDSVYAEIRDGRIVLTTNNGYPDDPRNRIILEPEIWNELKVFVERWELEHYETNE